MKKNIQFFVKCKALFNIFYVDLQKEWYDDKKGLTNHSYTDNFMKKTLFLFLMLLCGLRASAQEEYHIKNFGKADDLIVRSRVCFAQHNGFMWIGTTSGVIVFDGRHAH